MPAHPKIRVLQVIPSLQPGGAERMMIHLIQALDKDQYEAAAVSLGPRRDTELERMANDAGIDVRYLGKHAGFDPRMYWRFDRVLRQFRPQIVHVHLNALLYVMPSILMRRTPAVVYTAHNFPDLLVPRSLRWFYKASFHWGVVPVSIARSLSPVLSIEFRIPEPPLIRNGIPVSRFRQPSVTRTEWRKRAGFAESDFLFVCAARLSPQKNHALLLKAYAADPRLRRDSHLLLAGDGELREPLTRLAGELGIAARVHFLGNRDDVPEMLAACDVFTLSSAQEANPLCVMEAMAAGLPIVSTAVGGVPELVYPDVHGLLVEPNDAAGLTHAMGVMIQTQDFRRSCGQRSAEHALRTFDVSAMAQAYQELYGRLLHVPAKGAGWIREEKHALN